MYNMYHVVYMNTRVDYVYDICCMVYMNIWVDYVWYVPCGLHEHMSRLCMICTVCSTYIIQLIPITAIWIGPIINHFADEKNEAWKLTWVLVTWAVSGWGRFIPTQSALLTTTHSGQDHPCTVPWDTFMHFLVRINWVGDTLRMGVLYSTVFLTCPALLSPPLF